MEFIDVQKHLIVTDRLEVEVSHGDYLGALVTPFGWFQDQHPPIKYYTVQDDDGNEHGKARTISGARRIAKKYAHSRIRRAVPVAVLDGFVEYSY